MNKMDWNWPLLGASFLAGLTTQYVLNRRWSAAKLAAPDPPASDSDEDSSDDEDEAKPDGKQYKMVLVVRMDLEMGKGKMAAQVAHAALSGYKRARKATPEQAKQWSSYGQGKVVLKVPTGEELLEVQKSAKAEGLNTYLVMDAGKTQVASGTRTVLCIGPDEVSKVDKITRHLKLM